MKSPTLNESQIFRFSRWESIIVMFMITLIICAPWLLTRTSLFGIQFGDTGQIGDTIGGITAPFVGLLAAFIVYKSFTAQIAANQLLQKNHREQIDLIINEQSSNYLLTLYEKMEEDYQYLERQHHHTGWANELANGLARLDKLMNKNYKLEELKNFGHFNDGISEIQNSAPKVMYIYHNFTLLLQATINIMERNSDPNVEYIARYTCVKIDNLFKSNNYNCLLYHNIEEYEKQNMIDEKLYLELETAARGAKIVREMIDHILKVKKED